MDRMLRNRKAIVFFVAPAFVLFTVVLLIPILQMLYYSLCDYNALKEPVFIGLDVFHDIFCRHTTDNRSASGCYADQYQTRKKLF